ncbi:50S ribosomal protein L1 [Patescibacteria group bacterium]|nr:50S ribosomal protein L1 [Patescibacteria group bacterium]
MSKRLKEAKEKIDQEKKYTIEEAITLVKETSKVKFDATVEVHAKLNIDPKKSDQQMRASLHLPHGTGQTKRIAAFVSPDKVKEAEAAGAVVAGGEDLINEIKKTGKTDFDIVIATPDMMAKLAVIAKNLGQKGLMPNPKAGTITPDPAKVIKELNSGMISFKNDTSGNLHIAVGKVSFEDKLLIENVNAFTEELKKSKPDGVKGAFIKAIYVTSSMGPSIQIAIQ